MLGSDFVRLSSELFCIWCICPTWKCCDGRCYVAPTNFFVLKNLINELFYQLYNADIKTYNVDSRP